MSEEHKLQALVLAQQKHILKLEKSLKDLKNDISISRKHRLKIKDNSLIIKIKKAKWIFGTDSIFFQGKHPTLLKGVWSKMDKNTLEFNSEQGHLIYKIEVTRHIIGPGNLKNICIKLVFNTISGIRWIAPYYCTEEEVIIYQNFFTKFMDLVNESN